MHAMHEADVVIALGSRLSIFGTLPQYNFDYFPKNAKIIQVDIDQRRLGLSKNVDCIIHGDCKQSAASILTRLQSTDSISCMSNKPEREAHVAKLKATWEADLDTLTDLGA